MANRARLNTAPGYKRAAAAACPFKCPIFIAFFSPLTVYYRSLTFIPRILTLSRSILRKYLAKLGFEVAELWVIAEEILGLWKEPLRDPKDSAWKNRVPISGLVGASDNDLPNLSAVIQQCQNKTRRLRTRVRSNTHKHACCRHLLAASVRSRLSVA